MGRACIAHLSFCFEETKYRIFHRCFPPSFGSFVSAVSEKKIFRNRPTRNKNCIWQPCLYTNRDETTNLYREPSIDASYQVSIQLSKQFQIFRNRPIWNKNFLWRPCLLTDQDEISNLYRGPSIDASYQVSVHLVKWFQKKRFLEIDQSETRIACGSHICLRIGTKWTIFIEDLP